MGHLVQVLPDLFLAAILQQLRVLGPQAAAVSNRIAADYAVGVLEIIQNRIKTNLIDYIE